MWVLSKTESAIFSVMADEEPIDVLRNGVKEWNTWRENNPGTFINLGNEDLRGIDLRGADLNWAHLGFANLSQVDLSGAELYGAYLVGAHLPNTNLSRADLYGANLSSAFMPQADISAADLRGTNFSDAILAGVNLSEAQLYDTVLANVDLSNVTGLDSCHHRGPSTLDHRTLSRSGNLPLAFTRGCGLPDSLIDYLPSFIEAGPIQFYSCFISYSEQDQEFANRLHADLQNNSVRCWFAPHNMQAGKKVHEQIDEAIRVYDRLLLILSENSMKSNWVKTEVDHAVQKERNEGRKVLFPLSVVPFESVEKWRNFNADIGKDIAKEIREYFIPDFSHWKEHDAYILAFERLLRDLRPEKQAAAGPLPT
jgi:uncharacterized protein YjbI with pentapeptide repeats